ncbi:hypothetical protein [Corallococcus silvisoli]|uniref:hypothetical protein n=1 Tax=Corallococcus silvisoli TaxID=2697031 RepID=UPI001377FAB1|nr:hypothetical protein [Corallococcus silvisoli]NBD07678.1 hypothetical protein [Corallococcus silvisoli]
MPEGWLAKFSGGLVLILTLGGCATPGVHALPVGMHGYGRYHGASAPAFAKDTTVARRRTGGAVGREALGRYLAFIREKRVSLMQPAVMEVDRQEGHAVLNELLLWASSRPEEDLAKDAPLEVYLRLKARHARWLQAVRMRAAQVEASRRDPARLHADPGVFPALPPLTEPPRLSPPRPPR